MQYFDNFYDLAASQNQGFHAANGAPMLANTAVLDNLQTQANAAIGCVGMNIFNPPINTENVEIYQKDGKSPVKDDWDGYHMKPGLKELADDMEKIEEDTKKKIGDLTEEINKSYNEMQKFKNELMKKGLAGPQRMELEYRVKRAENEWEIAKSEKNKTWEKGCQEFVPLAMKMLEDEWIHRVVSTEQPFNEALDKEQGKPLKF